jgi:hypothetical protein
MPTLRMCDSRRLGLSAEREEKEEDNAETRSTQRYAEKSHFGT